MHRFLTALAIAATTATTADARGIYFQVFAAGKRAPLVAEDARMTRCDQDAEATLAKAGPVVTCRSVGGGGGGTLGAIARKQGGVDLLFLAPDHTIRWRRTFTGTAAYATDAMIVFEDGANTMRAMWLDPRDGHTLDTVAFVKDAKEVAHDALPTWCGDQILATFHSTERASRLAAVCLVLD